MPSIIKSSSVREASPGAPSSTGARSRSTRTCEKDVELLREGGLVRALQITCSCGDKTVVELSYPEPGPPEDNPEVSA